MDRRTFIKGAVVSSLAIGVAKTANAASYYPNNVDQSLFENINRVKNPAQKTPLEKSHAPFITAPASVKAGEPFIVEVSVGEKLHVMSPAHWIQNIDVDLLVDSLGNIPGDLMNWTFLNLKPYRLIGQKYIDMVDILDNPKQVCNFMYMEKWIFDSPDQAGEAYRQFVKDFYQDNKLIAGEVVIGDQVVNLKNIDVPVLNIYAQDDHLVPPSASKPLKNAVGTKDYTELSFKGGHIGIYVSGSAQALVPPSIGKWLNERS